MYLTAITSAAVPGFDDCLRKMYGQRNPEEQFQRFVYVVPEERAAVFQQTGGDRVVVQKVIK